MTRPFPITLVMVSYNKADVVGLVIESAASGSMKPDLLVVSDDGSDDGTPDEAERAAHAVGIPCLVIRNQRVGRYRIQTMRNACAANALNGVVYLSDSDCVFGEHAIESHYEIHRRYPLAIGTGPRFEFLEGTSGPFTSVFATLECAHFPEGHYSIPVGANYSFKKSLWKRLGGFDRAFEGSYGMEEFQFSQRAEKVGARCVSDPGAHVFHCPHETVFGSRSAMRNIGVFDATYGRDHCLEERILFEQRIAPWYWRGRRKRPILGSRVELNEWGAPDGFVPPLQLQLSRSLAPLIDPVRRWLDTRDAEILAELRVMTGTLDWRRLRQTSPALVYLSDLHDLLHNHLDESDIDGRMRFWLEGASAADTALRARPMETSYA